MDRKICGANITYKISTQYRTTSYHIILLTHLKYYSSMLKKKKKTTE